MYYVETKSEINDSIKEYMLPCNIPYSVTGKARLFINGYEVTGKGFYYHPFEGYFNAVVLKESGVVGTVAVGCDALPPNRSDGKYWRGKGEFDAYDADVISKKSLEAIKKHRS